MSRILRQFAKLIKIHSVLRFIYDREEGIQAGRKDENRNGRIERNHIDIRTVQEIRYQACKVILLEGETHEELHGHI